MKKIIFSVFLILFIAGCSRIGSTSVISSVDKSSKDKLNVVTTMFPIYDFTRAIGGDMVNVSLLVPPGSEPHEYEPTTADIINLNNADVFAYTGDIMEVWVSEMLHGITNENLEVVDTSKGTEIVENDPHIWLDFEHDKIMAKNIADALIKKDPDNENYYMRNLQDFLTKIDKINNAYLKMIPSCNTKEIVFGGHYAFGYMVRKFGLKYISAQGFSPDSEPTANDLIKLVNQIKKDGVKYIFYEELASTKVPETIARETNAQMLLLNNLESLTADEMQNGKTFIDEMYKNLGNIKIGLDCK